MAVSARRVATRRLSNVLFVGFCFAVTVIALGALALILYSLVTQGIGGINLRVFTMSTPAAGSPGGLLNAIVGSIMILPFMAATLRDLLATVPAQVRESAYGLGATTGEVVMKVTLPYVRRGAIGAVMLGLGRALGETMAVTFIIGNSHDFPKGLFDAGSTIASTIANEFNEASGLQASALIALGLVLFLITFTVLALARLLLRNQARV